MRLGDGGLTLELAPAHERSAGGAQHRADHHPVHDLAIAEALQPEPPEEVPVLSLLECEGERRAEPVDDEKEGVPEQDCRQPGHHRFLRVLQPLEKRCDEAPDQRQVDDRRQEREQDLEQPDARHRDQAERAVARTQQRAAVLPQALERAVRPAEALLREPRSVSGASVHAIASSAYSMR